MTQNATARRQTPRKQAGPTAAKKAATSKRAAPLHATIQDKPIGRLAKLFAEVEQPGPYELTEACSLEPPDKARMALIVSAQTAYVIARGQLESMMSPMTDQDGKVLLDEQQQPMMPNINRGSLNSLEEVVQKAAESYDRALFGNQYDEVMRMSQKWTGAEWNAFYKDVQDYFLPVPEDGLCPTCGNVIDQEEAGKAPASETSSNGIGTSSKAILQPT